MPWNRPSLKQLYERIARDFSARLQEGRELVSQSVEAVLGKVWAGAVNTCHIFLGWIFRMCMVDTSEGVYLDRWGMVWNYPRAEADFAAGEARFSAAAGTVIPAGRLLTGPDGQELMATADGDEAGGFITVHAEALSAGSAGNIAAGSLITLASPIEGVQSAGETPQGFSGGTDRETDDVYRARLLARLRQPPRGGSKSDYENWAKEVPGVTRAWCYPLYSGLGTVGLTFVTDNAEGSPIPSDEMVARVDAHIRPLIPADVWSFTVFKPTLLNVPVTLAVKPDTAAVRQAVTAAIKNFETQTARPDTVIPLTQLDRAVPPAAEDFVRLAPTQDITVGKEEYPTFTVTFTDWLAGNENG